jgi:hypothetical protein
MCWAIFGLSLLARLLTLGTLLTVSASEKIDRRYRGSSGLATATHSFSTATHPFCYGHPLFCYAHPWCVFSIVTRTIFVSSFKNKPVTRPEATGSPHAQAFEAFMQPALFQRHLLNDQLLL